MESEFKIGQGDENGLNMEVSIKGNGKTNAELMEDAVKLLIGSFDVKGTFNENHVEFDRLIGRLLLAVTDLAGYESYYNNLSDDSGAFYNEYDEFVVPNSVKIEFLECLVGNLKEELVK